MVDPSAAIDRKTIDDMTTDEIDAALSQRRARRLVAFAVYQEGIASKLRATNEREKEQLTKHLDILTRDFARIDKILVKIDERLNKVASIRLALEDYNGTPST